MVLFEFCSAEDYFINLIQNPEDGLSKISHNSMIGGPCANWVWVPEDTCYNSWTISLALTHFNFNLKGF